MIWRYRIGLFASAAVLFVLGACGDALRTDGSSEYDSREKPVKVVPNFEIEGTHDLPENVRFGDLSLTVASIKLTPLESERTVAFSSSQPDWIEFDVGEGALEQTGRAIRIPETGRYNVTLRLEPVEESSSDSARPMGDYSLALSGHVAGVSTEETADGGDQDGGPVPMPASPDEFGENSDGEEGSGAVDRTQTPSHWMPFEYTTDQSVRITLDAVRLTEGEQYLNFELDANEWASEIATPVARAVWSQTRAEEPKSSREEGAVNVTRAVDSRGEGSTTLKEYMSVTASGMGGAPGF